MAGVVAKISKLFSIIKQNGGIRGSIVTLFRTDELKDGTLVGEDYLGNKYYENNRYFLGRNRWVVYGNRFGWDYEASQMDDVRLPPSVFQTIVTHALTHEREEVAGLLAVEVLESHLQIYAAIPLPRSVQKSDRVEISPEDMSIGATKCEELEKSLGRKLSVLGWYHSHPHITPHPSAIDKEMQGELQKLDSKFFGIIVSVFVSERDKKEQVISFIGFRKEDRPIKVTIEPLSAEIVSPIAHFKACLDMWRSIPSAVFEEIARQDDGCQRLLKTRDVVNDVIFPMTTSTKYLDSALHLPGKTNTQCTSTTATLLR
ncbi:unnamed protein product [Mesocestoides corti]|uniref:MPN domain-containing protein n=1 Tax=Mesocestoides corti TaxID=53468 RepID=A0A0R3UHN8_MESCO|nr:unnamed protein product [Mesocestoides corti]